MPRYDPTAGAQYLKGFLGNVQAQKQMQRRKEMQSLITKGLSEGTLQPSFSVNETGAISVNYKPPEKKKDEDKPYQDAAEWKRKNAQKTIFMEYIKTQFPESYRGEKEKGEKLTDYAGWLRTSKGEVVRRLVSGKPIHKTKEGKLDAAKTMEALEMKLDDVYAWATENQPELAKIAFPGKSALLKAPTNDTGKSSGGSW